MPFRTMAAAGVAGLAITLAGCTSSEGTDIPAGGEATASATPESTAELTVEQAVLKQAAENTAASGSARFRADIESSAGPAAAAGSVQLDGVYNFDPQQIQTTITSNAGGQKVNAELVVVDGKSYVKMAELGGDNWVEMPIEQLGLTDSILSPQDSMGNLSELTGIKKVGKEDIDGVATTKYEGSMKIQDAMADAGLADQNGEVKGTADVEVWVDEEDRLVRVNTIVKAKVEGQEVKSSTSMTFSDYGVEVDVTAPPAEDVVDVSELNPAQGQTPQTP
ncbi:MAG: LppX_LprAFG lipoprotein [Actinomycetia bacterium]|nr:LppX_LprAFG lipoprotein [Actinomycetes bacterium]